MKDTQYLSVSSRIRAMEMRLVTRDRLERMIDAADDAQALKVLSECGYGEVSDASPAALEAALTAGQAAAEKELAAILPQPELLDWFRIPRDYDNVKTLLKAARAGRPAERLLLSGGRYDPAALARLTAAKGAPAEVSEAFRAAAAGAADVLERTGDAQQADLVLDRACHAEQADLAARLPSPLLQSYTRLAADAANLRTLVRCARLEKDGAFLSAALLPGGNVAAEELARLSRGEAIHRFRSGALAEAAALAEPLARPDGPPLTELERVCDDALTAHLAGCRRVPFGQEVVIGYLFARRTEQTAVRIVMAGRRAGLEPDVIRQRLRACYV